MSQQGDGPKQILGRNFLPRLNKVGLRLRDVCFEDVSNALHLGVNPKIGFFPAKWMVKIMENPIKMDDLGGKKNLFLG